MRLSVDVGGTFTDLVVEDGAGLLKVFKAPTTSPDRGRARRVALAAADDGRSTRRYWPRRHVRPRHDARDQRHPDRQHGADRVPHHGGPSRHPGDPRGRPHRAFNFTVPYPEPYVPRALTFEVPERIGADGRMVRPLARGLGARHRRPAESGGVEAVAVCLLWSIVNPAHELRRRAARRASAGRPVHLSHQLNPSLREYRRASSTCIDASLKPLMSGYLRRLTSRLREAGSPGRCWWSPRRAASPMPRRSPSADPSLSIPARRWRRSPAAITPGRPRPHRDRRRHRRHQLRRQPGPPRRIPWTRETWLGPPFRAT